MAHTYSMLGGLAQTTGTGQSGPPPPLSNAGFNHPRVQRDWSDRTPPPPPFIPCLLVSLSPFSAETFSSRYQVVGKGRLNRLGEKRRQARPGLGVFFFLFLLLVALFPRDSFHLIPRIFVASFFFGHAKQNEDSVRVEVGVLIQYRRGGVCARGNGHWRFCNNPSGERDTMEPKGTIDWTNLQIWGKRRKKQKTTKKKKVCLVRGALQEGLVTGRFEAVAAGGR